MPQSVPSNVAAPSGVPRLLSMREVQAISKYSRPSIYRLVKEGLMPGPIKLGQAKVAFREDEIKAWVESRSRVIACVVSDTTRSAA